MINELHVSLITQLKGVKGDWERGSEKDERERQYFLVFLCPRFDFQARVGMIYAWTYWKTYNQNDKVKLVWSFQHPGNNCIQSWIPLCCLLKITGSNYALSISTLSQLVSWKSFQHQRPTFASTSAFGLYYIASCCWVSLMEWLAYLSLIAQTLSKTVLTTELYVMTKVTVCLLISFFFFLSAYIENLYCD